jgi:hypothetical protein
MKTLKILSTIKEIIYSDSDGVIIAHISRDKSGKIIVKGSIPAGPHWCKIVYIDPLRKPDESFVAGK